MKRRSIAALVLLSLLVNRPVLASDQEPQFAPNAKYSSVSITELSHDIQTCKSAAAKQVAPSALKRERALAPDTQPLNSTTPSAQNDLISSADRKFRKLAEECLESRGYKVVDWKYTSF